MDEIISKEQINQLIEDASYMQDEAEALKYVIDHVSYCEQPPDGRSIAGILAYIDYIQKFYYRHYLEKAAGNLRPTRIDNFGQFSEDYEEPDETFDDIQSLLDDVAKHRAGILNLIRNISSIDWSSDVYVNNHKISLFEFIQQMIHFDRIQLKKIAELVRLLGEQKQTERQIKRKREMRNPSIRNTD